MVFNKYPFSSWLHGVLEKLFQFDLGTRVFLPPIHCWLKWKWGPGEDIFPKRKYFVGPKRGDSIWLFKKTNLRIPFFYSFMVPDKGNPVGTHGGR